jgi:hypothetical protein
MDTEDSSVLDAAVDGLLAVVERSAGDLRAFHDAVAQTRRANPAPFPRVAVVTAESIIDHLKTVEEKMQEVMVALGLTASARHDQR